MLSLSEIKSSSKKDQNSGQKLGKMGAPGMHRKVTWHSNHQAESKRITIFSEQKTSEKCPEMGKLQRRLKFKDKD